METTMQKSILIAGLLALSATAASAHATLEQREAAAGKTTKITLRVPHGCKGEATRTVNLMIPEGFYNAKPMPKAGWELTTETGTYSTPYNNHGKEMTEGARKVIWSGGNLENGWYDEFTIRGTVGPDVAPGTVMYFPALQECANGVADWTNTSGAKDAKHPAPKLTAIAEEGGHHAHAMAAPESFTVGDLTIESPFSRATLPNQPVGWLRGAPWACGFRRLKGFRRIFSRFEKLDVMYRAFLNVALIVEMIKC
ncbi:YcnI family protein [Halovulum sp. GXIMD14793]